MVIAVSLARRVGELSLWPEDCLIVGGLCALMDDHADHAPGMANGVGQLGQGCDNDGKISLFHLYTDFHCAWLNSKSHCPEDLLAE